MQLFVTNKTRLSIDFNKPRKSTIPGRIESPRQMTPSQSKMKVFFYKMKEEEVAWPITSRHA